MTSSNKKEVYETTSIRRTITQELRDICKEEGVEPSIPAAVKFLINFYRKARS